MVKRRKTITVSLGSLKLGSAFPIAIQSMTNTRTSDVQATVKQIKNLEKLGCDLVRVAVPDLKSARVLSDLKKKIKIPLAADIHFDYRLALEAIKQGVDKIRINPGNLNNEEKLKEIINLARGRKTAIRLGLNSGSLEREFLEKYGRPSSEALAASALKWIKFFEQNNFRNLMISLKSSDVQDTIKAYELIAEKCSYPLHLGVTAAGTRIAGTVKSALGIGGLLMQGIGDTIRVSLAEKPEEEIKAAKEILKSLGLYQKEPTVIACPSCGRAEIDVLKLARMVEKKVQRIKKPLKIAVMGCVINGPGEAREADFGIAGGRKEGVIFKKGKVVKKVPEKNLAAELFKIISS